MNLIKCDACGAQSNMTGAEMAGWVKVRRSTYSLNEAPELDWCNRCALAAQRFLRTNLSKDGQP